MSIDSDEMAAMAFTRLAEGEDAQAVELVSEYGYAQAFEIIADCARGATPPVGYEKPMPRWVHRFDSDAFARDLDRQEELGLGFTYRGASTWPEAFEYLGDGAPLGLWYQGSLTMLEAPAISVVGSRDCSEYGRKIAYDFAYDLAEGGYIIISGGAVGIDAAGHAGALAASRRFERGATVVVFANGLGRFYPKSNTSLFTGIAHSGGLFLSEAPPDASPHRHRFLSRNRIIAALGHITLVVEAPYRSGALSTARHALTIGREVAVVPGAITSPHSAGCHRLLREGGICVASLDHIYELLPPAPNSFRLPAEGRRANASRAEQAERDRAPVGSRALVNDAMAGHPLAVRVREGLAPRSTRSAGEIAREAGVSVREAIAALGMLEAAGIAEHIDGLWRLARVS